ncbi:MULTISPECIES: glutathione S-transferase family protein [Variovorax]|jgi:glutathione S-transferase|uniref:Glutathione S-transferase n=1 Tax=Variovorax paradoxus TaxID=34073 RepID=A0AA91IDS6_VARPD|nr:MULTISPECIES: glutathione S-transferase family protein [Variovorax]AVQ82017.1 glutathione S-transferase family protein [Variovorax sp. PMC12]OAK67035.1 glutathione S-transferase [Variovorax paradoxus]QRY33729.1 glutathione S-transferase family protein [Variovorax sp. PDNC026]
MRKLYIGNKNYSSWSMRPWVLMKQAGIPFEEVMVRFDSFEADSKFKNAIAAINPVAKVPVLVDGDLVVWDTLAIAEYLAETFPEKQLWPRDAADRARARSVCAEMHSGFGGLRGHCGMNLEASLPEVGARLMKEEPTVASDLARIVQMWSGLLDAHGGPMLFGEFGIADAYFAPVGTRIKTYGLPVPPHITAYIERVQALPGVKAWIDGGLAEKDFLQFEEPYRTGR